MKKIILAVSLLAAPMVQAATDIYIVNESYGQTGYSYTYGQGAAAATVSYDAANQTATIMAWSRSTEGYKYWRGSVPASTVASNGINGISISIDTCLYTAETEFYSYPATSACGLVDVTITANVPAVGWTTSGVTQDIDDGYIQQTVGSTINRVASPTGSVNGVSVANGRQARMVKGNVSITVTTEE